MSKTRRKTTAGGGDLTVVVGGWYMADAAMAARLERGDRPAYEDIRACMKRCEPGDRLRAADLPPWTLAQMWLGGFFAEAEDGEPPWEPPTADVDADTDTDDSGERGAPGEPYTWDGADFEGVNNADV
jgi:hypothetical protein